MRIVVTGAAGFIGGHLFQRLLQQGHVLCGIVRTIEETSPTRVASAAKLQSVIEGHPNAVLRACNSLDSLLEIVARFRPDACVHLAGRSSVRESLQNPGLYEDANCRFSMGLLEALRAAGCRRVVHASTVMVYGKDAPAPYCEKHLGSSPLSFYGASKLAVETQMNAWRALHGMETINLRLFSVYGPGLRRDCVPYLIASAILENRGFNLFGDGSSQRDYVALEDVLAAIEAALSVRWTDSFPTALNIGSGKGTRLIDLIQLLERGLGKKLTLEFKPPVQGELHSIIADVNQTEASLGWRPRVELAEGMGRLAKWFLDFENFN